MAILEGLISLCLSNKYLFSCYSMWFVMVIKIIKSLLVSDKIN